ncbi:MAG: type II secretion system F family protein [Pseudomonadales bacterium]|nr:type II secretion system F family protein [Pseudomonadales bacterium]
MKHFHYTGYQEQGAQIQGWLMAFDREDALKQLRSRGINPFTIQPGPGYIPLRVPVDELLVSLRELASLRRSGMAIDQAVQAVIETAESKSLIQAWTQIAQMLGSGMALSDAFGAVPDAFPRYAVPLVRLGEANGELAEAVTIIADRLDEELKLKGEVRSALVYPAFLMLVSVAVVLFLFTVVVPKFGAMVTDSIDGANSSMLFLLAISAFLRDYAWVWFGGFALLVLAIYHFWRSGKIQALMWSCLRLFPGVKSVMGAWEVVQFCSSMARLLTGGVAVLDAVNLSGEALGRDEIRSSLTRTVDSVRRGETLGNALSDEKVFPKLVIQMISIGEKSAHLAGTMNEISVLYERRMRESIRRALSLLEPIVIATMGIIVGGIITSLLSAIIAMNDIPI